MDHKILLIDDSAILRRIATNVLNAQVGCREVITATRATEGFALACTAGVSLILVDYQIAGLPGADLCKRLLDEPRTRCLPIVLLVSPSLHPPDRKALPSNVVEIISKPFTPEQLVQLVHTVFDTPLDEPPAPKVRAMTIQPDPAFIPRGRSPRRVSVVPGPAAAPQPCRRGGFDPGRLRAALAAAAERGETGVLRVNIEGQKSTEIYFETGKIVLLATREADRYGADAGDVVTPKVSATLLDDAVAEQAATGVPFFLTLGSRGLLSKTTAVAMLHRFGQRYLTHLWTAPSQDLSFEFSALDALPGFALRLEPRREPVDDWLLGALRQIRAADIADMARSEGFGGTPLTRGNRPGLSLDAAEDAFTRLIDGRRDLASVAKESSISVEAAYLMLFRFRCLGMMDYRPKSSAFVVTPRTSVRRVLPLSR